MSTETNKWTLHFATYSRNEALYMADFLARAVDSKFFHDPDNVPLFIVTGGFNHGKSMICEAMSRSILDQESIEEMIKEGQRFHHYLETAPSTALSTYCSQIGTIGGKIGAVSFDRITEFLLYSLPVKRQETSSGLLKIFGRSTNQQEEREPAEKLYQQQFSLHTALYSGLKDGYSLTKDGPVRLATGEKTPLDEACDKVQRIGGAIFSSGHTKLDVTSWIHFAVEQPEFPDYAARAAATGKSLYHDHDPRHPKWHKVWDIEVLSPQLQNSPRFQAFWGKLQDYARISPLNKLQYGAALKKFNL